MKALDPRRSCPATATIDECSASVFDEAVEKLTVLRAPMHQGDAVTQLHAMMSLVAEAKARLPRVVADARDQEHTWTAIAQQLGVARMSAMLRYVRGARNRRSPLDPD
jgi:hypothetical protein